VTAFYITNTYNSSGENMVSAQQTLRYNEAHLLQAIGQVRIARPLLLLHLASSERLSKQSDGILHRTSENISSSVEINDHLVAIELIYCNKSSFVQ
jgi:hypothetical protein